MNRKDLLDNAMAEPEVTEILGLRVRKISLGTLMLLARLGNPFAQADKLAALGEGVSAADMAALGELVFVCAAPEEDVERLVYRERRNFAAEADRFCSRIPLEAFAQVTRAIFGDAAAIRAAEASALPGEHEGASKNAPSPAA